MKINTRRYSENGWMLPLTHVSKNIVRHEFNEYCIRFGSSQEGKEARKPLAIRKWNWQLRKPT